MSGDPKKTAEPEQAKAYRPCDPVPSHEPTVRRHLAILSEQAQRVCPPGSLMQISSVHPADDKLVPVGRFMMGDIDHMVEAAIGAADAGFNVYIEGRTIRRDTPRGLRGDASCTAGVFALARDNDGDKNKTAKAELTPSLMVETSPGNYHPWYFPSEPMSVEAAQEIGEGMRAAGGDAGATGKLTQPYRIAGTSNYPNLIKQRRGRFDVHPTSILEGSGVTYSADELRAAFPAPKKEQRTAGNGRGADWQEGVDWQEAVKDLPEDLRTLIEEGVAQGHRSSKFHSVVCQLKYRGWSADNILELLDSYPNGIAQKYAGRLRKNVDASFAKGDAPPDPAAVFKPAAPSVIRIERGTLHGQATEGERALIAAGVPFYAHADELQKPIVDEVEATKGRKAKIARLASVSLDMLRDYLSRSVQWERYNERKNRYVPAEPPRDVAAIILSREGEWQFPPTTGVITTPTLRPDGSILGRPGYDPATRLILIHPPAMPVIPENPTRDDAAAALQMLDDLLDEFPFVDAASRAVALSELITPVVRGAMPVAPLHCNRAPTPGSGKSFLLDIASAISTGQPCPVISAGTDEFETEKRLGAALLKGQALIAIDNLNGELRGDALCQMIERPIVDVRILGLSRSVRIESRATLFATGNNIVLVGDVVRRVVTASLDSDLERPELRQFKGNPFDTVLLDRGRYVAAALTVVRAYLATGCPGELPPLASFGDWSRLVRSPLVWLGRADPVETMETARADDPELDDLRRVVAGWQAAVGLSRPCTAGELKQAAECTIDEKQRQQADGGAPLDTQATWVGSGLAHPEFHEALLNVAYGSRGIDARKLGHFLGRQRGRIVDGCKLTSREDTNRKQQLWSLRRAGRADNAE